MAPRLALLYATGVSPLCDKSPYKSFTSLEEPRSNVDEACLLVPPSKCELALGLEPSRLLPAAPPMKPPVKPLRLSSSSYREASGKEENPERGSKSVPHSRFVPSQGRENYSSATAGIIASSQLGTPDHVRDIGGITPGVRDAGEHGPSQEALGPRKAW